RPGPQREAERVAEAVRDDPAQVRVAARALRVRREPGARCGVDAEDGAVQDHRLAGRAARALAAERAALARRRRQGGADGARRVAARIRRGRGWAAGGPAELAVVGIPEVRALPAGGVERTVSAEVEVADRVARELLAPALDQHLLV